MASAWGQSWGQYSWGVSWGATTSSPPIPSSAPFEPALFFRCTIQYPEVFFSTNIQDHYGGHTKIIDQLIGQTWIVDEMTQITQIYDEVSNKTIMPTEVCGDTTIKDYIAARVRMPGTNL